MIQRMASECNGVGRCLKERECVCVCAGVTVTCKCGHSHDCSETCRCGHKAHNGYCPDLECEFQCTPRMCGNWQLCKEFAPQYVLNAHKSMTPDCESRFGRLIFLDERRYCYLCDHDTLQVKLDCGHVYCRGCYKVDVMMNGNWDTLSKCDDECGHLRK